VPSYSAGQALRPNEGGGASTIVGSARDRVSYSAIRGELIMKAFIGISILGLLVSATAPVHATTYFAQAKCGGSGTYDIETNRSADEGCSYSTQDFTNFVEASAEADLGGLHADAHGDGHDLGQATAVITDNYLVTAPALAGTTGTLKFNYYVHGVTSDPHAKGTVLVSVDSTDVYTDPAAAIAFVQNIDGADSFAGKGAIGVSFQFGGANDIETALELQSENGTIDFDDTVELIGIQAFDSAGKPVPRRSPRQRNRLRRARRKQRQGAWLGRRRGWWWSFRRPGGLEMGDDADRLRRAGGRRAPSCAKRRRDGVTNVERGGVGGRPALRDWRPRIALRLAIQSESAQTRSWRHYSMRIAHVITPGDRCESGGDRQLDYADGLSA
jgi:hypothetical protein